MRHQCVELHLQSKIHYADVINVRRSPTPSDIEDSQPIPNRDDYWDLITSLTEDAKKAQARGGRRRWSESLSLPTSPISESSEFIFEFGQSTLSGVVAAMSLEPGSNGDSMPLPQPPLGQEPAPSTAARDDGSSVQAPSEVDLLV